MSEFQRLLLQRAIEAQWKLARVRREHLHHQARVLALREELRELEQLKWFAEQVDGL